MIEKIDKCVGKGEVESSILSGSTTEFNSNNSVLARVAFRKELAYRHLFGRIFGRSDERSAE
jgi:hypothetical protein